MQTWVLRTLIVSIVASAVAAIVALVSPEFGEVQEKTLGTALTFSAVSLNAMACAAAWDARRRVGYAPVWGIALSYSVFALVTAAIWAGIESETFVRVVTTLAVVGVAAAHASLLRRVALTRPAELTGFAAIGAAAVLGGLFVGLTWTWTHDPPEVILRLLGLAGVLFASTTIATPVVHLLTRGREARVRHPAESAAFCPRCGSKVGGAAGWVRCRACGARFQIRFGE